MSAGLFERATDGEHAARSGSTKRTTRPRETVIRQMSADSPRNLTLFLPLPPFIRVYESDKSFAAASAARCLRTLTEERATAEPLKTMRKLGSRRARIEKRRTLSAEFPANYTAIDLLGKDL